MKSKSICPINAEGEIHSMKNDKKSAAGNSTQLLSDEVKYKGTVFKWYNNSYVSCMSVEC